MDPAGGGGHGVVLWLLFQQHKLERLEALEHDDIAGGESGLTDDESRVAARRLRTMHRITVPASSLFLLCALVDWAGST